MKVQLLISAMFAEPKELVNKMNVSSEAVLINQCDVNGFENFWVQDADGIDREIKAYSHHTD